VCVPLRCLKTFFGIDTRSACALSLRSCCKGKQVQGQAE
jgi:hypothetical protein